MRRLLKKPSPTFWTVGYLIEKNKETVKIAGTKDEKGEWSTITAFPSGSVKEIKYIPS